MIGGEKTETGIINTRRRTQKIMKTLGYYNGKIDELDRMMIPMNDRSSYFGDGVYDATYCRNYKIFALDEHIDRFFRSAALLRIEVAQSKEELRDLLNELVRKLDDDEQFVYFQATRGTGMRDHVFPQDGSKANLWVTLTPRKIMEIDRKLKLVTMEDTRFLHCNIKTINLIPSVMASQRAKEHGCQETVFHRGDRVTECAHSNVHILKDGVFRTAPTDCYILPGIARAHLISACGRLGIPVDETPFTLEELMAADEVIVSSSGCLGLAADEIDGKPVGGKAPELLKKIQNEVWNEFMTETAAD